MADINPGPELLEIGSDDGDFLMPDEVPTSWERGRGTREAEYLGGLGAGVTRYFDMTGKLTATSEWIHWTAEDAPAFDGAGSGYSEGEFVSGSIDVVKVR